MGVLDQAVDPVVARGIQRQPGAAVVWSTLPAGTTNVPAVGAANSICGWAFYAGTPAASFSRIAIPFICTQAEYVPTAFLVRIRHTDQSGAILATGTAAVAASLSVEEVAEVTLSATVTTAQPIWVEIITDGRVQMYNITTAASAAVYPTPTYPQTRYWTDINQSNPGATALSGSQRLYHFWSYADDSTASTRKLASDLGADMNLTGWPGRVASVHPSLIETASIGTVNWTANVSSSTFSGWGFYAGNQTTSFNAVALWLRAFNASFVAKVGVLRIRQMPADSGTWSSTNPASWTILAESRITQLGLAASTWRQVVFALPKSVSGHVWIEFQTDGYTAVSMNAGGTATPTYAAPPTTCYVTGSLLAQPKSWTAVGTHYTPHARLGNYDFRGGRLAVRTEFSGQISGGSATVVNPTVAIALPTNAQNILPALEGRELNVYFDGCIWASVPLDQLCVDVTCTKGAQFGQWWRYTPTSGDAGSTTFTLAVYTKDRATLLASAAATLKTVALTHPTVAVSRKVLMIGDSTWANGIVAAELVNLFNGDAKYTLTLVGSNNGNVNDSGAVSRAVSVEAISGWTFNLFTTDTATAWTEIGGTARTGSPFSFAGAFNFASYLSAQSITMASGDWVLINLGINDIFGATDDTTLQAALSTMSTQLAAWITSIKAAVSGVRIGLCVTIPPNANQDAFGVNYTSVQTLRRYEQNLRLWRAELLANHDTTVASNVYVIPYHVGLDRVNNFPTSSVALNARNSTTYDQSSNGVHPANAGYWQLADVLRSYLKAVET
jgi:lysophospholipase L1-like esterase